jgi:hypothetical protein
MQICSATDSSSPQEIVSQEHLKGLKRAIESQDDEILTFQRKLSGKRDFASSNSSEKDYYSMTIPQLKSECRSAGLKVGGTKAELISRLQANS